MLALPPVGTSAQGVGAKPKAGSADTTFEAVLGSALGAFLTPEAVTDESGQGLAAMLRGQAETLPLRLPAAVGATGTEEEGAEGTGGSAPTSAGTAVAAGDLQDGEDGAPLVEGTPEGDEPGPVRPAAGATPASVDGEPRAEVRGHAPERAGDPPNRGGEAVGTAQSAAADRLAGARLPTGPADADAADPPVDELAPARAGTPPAGSGGAGAGDDGPAARAGSGPELTGEQRGLATAAPRTENATPEALRTESPARPEQSPLLNRIVRIAERLEQAPPPRQMTIEIGELRLSVSLRGDNGVRVVAAGDPGQTLDGDWRRDLSDALAERGLDLEHPDDQGDPDPQDHPSRADTQRQAGRSRRQDAPDDALRL